MASDIRFIISGTNYRFAYGATTAPTAYTGSGTPWTVQSTTPFKLRMEGIWAPKAAEPDRSYAPAPAGGGALAVNAVSYALIEETIPIAIQGTTPAARATALRALRRALAIGLNRRAVILAFEVNDVSSGMSPVYFEVLHADVQTDARTLTGEFQQTATADGRRSLWATITLTRRPLGGILQGTDTPETVANAAALSNVQGGNTVLITPSRGDLINDGQPLNLTITPAAGVTALRYYLATIAGNEVDTTGWGSTALSSSFASLGVATFSGSNLATLLTQYPVTARLFVRLSAISSSAGLRCLLSLAGGSTYHTVDLSGNVGTVNGTLFDCGDIPIPIAPGPGIAGNPDLRVDVRAAGSGNATVGYVEIILYYDYCVIPGASTSSTVSLELASYPVNDGRVMLPFEQPQAFTTTGGTQVRQPLQILGSAPRARNGASLWLYGTRDDTWPGTHNTSDSYTVNAYSAPLYLDGQRVD